MSLSGRQWINQFPSSTSTNDLTEPFRRQVNNFLAALRAAGASVTIEATLRPAKRAYLMHWSFRIAREGQDPSTVPAMAGVDIQWVHPDRLGHPDRGASRTSAAEMVQGYEIVFRPALASRHTEGKAIDMDISWQQELSIAGADGKTVVIKTVPRTGGNAELQSVGAGYGVHKLASDPPHWSSDGH